MSIQFDRSVCRDLNETISREWLVTNGLGGYATGTIAGVLTRRQHGLLVALPPDATTPQLMLAKIDEEVVFDERTYYLGTNEYRDGTLNPSGFVHLEHFRLEEGFPIFTYHLGGINGMMLEKRIWMPQGLNTTYIQYRVLHTASDRPDFGRSGPLRSPERFSDYVQERQQALTLTLLPLAAYRPYDQIQRETSKLSFQVQCYRPGELIEESRSDFGAILPPGVAGCTLRAQEDALPCHIVAVGHPESNTTFIPTGIWYWNFLHRNDAKHGEADTDNFYLPGVIRTTLRPGEDSALTIIISTEHLSTQTFSLNQINLSYKRGIEKKQRLLENVVHSERYFGEGGEAAHAQRLYTLPLTTAPDPYEGGKEYLKLLLSAADRYLIHRPLRHSEFAMTERSFFKRPETTAALLSNSYSMHTTTREALIALPGLLLIPERYDEALNILQEVTRHIKHGMLPDRLPLPDQSLTDDDYGSVDTTLWYFYALDHYLQATHHYEFLEGIYYRLTEIVNRYIHGTLHGISVDTNDGLLRASHSHKPLTWMNAQLHGQAVTPRSGKAVEVNALWYNALALMHQWSQYLNHMGHLNHFSSYYQELMLRCRESFQRRFWYAEGNYLYDVVDGKNGDDIALRPNQLLAFSLQHPVLSEEYRSAVFDSVTEHLLTPYGLRTLSPQDSAYRGHLGNRLQERQVSLHQGSIWTWLSGPYVDAMIRLRSQVTHPASSTDDSLYQEYIWRKGLRVLEPLKERFYRGFLGMVEGVFDGDNPHQGSYRHGTMLANSELLRIYTVLARMRVLHQEYALSH